MPPPVRPPLHPGGRDPLQTDLGCASSAWPPEGLTDLYDFSDGTSGDYISDGGDDMYDWGNYITVSDGGYWSSNLEYSQTCSGEASNSTWSDDVQYGTCKLTTGLSPAPLFMAVFSSATASIGGIANSGSLGCWRQTGLFPRKVGVHSSVIRMEYGTVVHAEGWRPGGGVALRHDCCMQVRI